MFSLVMQQLLPRIKSGIYIQDIPSSGPIERPGLWAWAGHPQTTHQVFIRRGTGPESTHVAFVRSNFKLCAFMFSLLTFNSTHLQLNGVIRVSGWGIINFTTYDFRGEEHDISSTKVHYSRWHLNIHIDLYIYVCIHRPFG